LTKQIESVYSALITQIELFGGSVIDFAGDSMFCWFDDDLSLVAKIDVVSLPSAAHRAAACGLALQGAMQAFAEIDLPDHSTTALELKVAIASGTVRRFVLGDPKVHVMDIVAGATIARMAAAEHLTRKGEVIVDEATVNILGDGITIQEWREDLDGADRFAVVAGLTRPITPLALKDVGARDLALEVLQPWLHPALIEREGSGGGSLQTEFRPCVALFVRFLGIDYDADEAGMHLDQFVRETQMIAARRGGIFLQITIGDKGSYAYLNFGALTAHEDDVRRAVTTALELRELAESLDFLKPLQVGITRGTMRVGAYGGETRKTFGALGDEVNLAARLMMNAAAGEILLSSVVHKAVINDFICEPRQPLQMKGKAEPLPVFAVTGNRQRRAVRLQEPNYSLPMVGRQAELNAIEEKLDLAAQGKSQVIGIVAEAGLGKSRLVAEVIRNARRKGFVGFGGACQSDGIHTPYLTWKSIWGAFFGIDPDDSLKRQMRNLEGEIEDRAPSRVNAMPLLNVMLDLNIPENDFTQNLEPKIRQSALHALLEDCLKAQAADEPTMIVIEDLHWIDALSHDLLEGLAKALANYAVCFVLAYRPPQLERLQEPRIEALEQFTRIELHELTTTEATLTVRAKLTQLYPARGGALPAGLVEALMRRAQGNPFYLEELLNYVRDRGLDPSNIQNIELPDSLHTLILSRIDQLSEAEKTTLRVASIVGRLFRAKWLTGYYPELGSFTQVKAALDALDKLEITPLDTPEPELAYLFKHIVTHEVTYESLPFATRARLHEQLAQYLESIVEATHESPLLDTITFHYLRSENKEKQIEYLRKAGGTSQKNYANDAALEYYGQLLPLLMDDKEKIQTHLKRGEVLGLIGKYDDAKSDFRAALDSATNEPALKASAQFALGKLSRFRGDYAPALEWLRQAKEAHNKLKDIAGPALVLIETGWVLYRKGEYEQARQPLNEGLALAREAGDNLNTALALYNLGAVAYHQGDKAGARALFEESLAFRRERGDKAGIAGSLVSLGVVALAQGDYAAARALCEECLARQREMGNKQGIALTLVNLGAVAHAQKDYAGARALCEESLALNREMGDKFGITWSLSKLGFVAMDQGNNVAARALYEESLALCKEMDEKTIMAYLLLGLGLVELAESKPEARENILRSLRLRVETGQRLLQTSSLIGVAGLVMQEGDPGFAAQLLGAVKSALKGLNAVVESEVKFFHEQILAKVKEALGDAAFQSAWEEGSRWSLEEAVKKVLDDKS